MNEHQDKPQVQNTSTLGIDLARWLCQVAIIDDTGKPIPIPGGDGQLGIPSAVYFGEGMKEKCTGSTARALRATEPERVYEGYKRLIGTGKELGREGNVVITPELCAEEQLRDIRQTACQYFNSDKAASKAVLAVPSEADEKYKQAIKARCRSQEVTHLCSREGIHLMKRAVAFPFQGGSFSSEEEIPRRRTAGVTLADELPEEVVPVFGRRTQA